MIFSERLAVESVPRVTALFFIAAQDGLFPVQTFVMIFCDTVVASPYTIAPRVRFEKVLFERVSAPDDHTVTASSVRFENVLFEIFPEIFDPLIPRAQLENVLFEILIVLVAVIFRQSPPKELISEERIWIFDPVVKRDIAVPVELDAILRALSVIYEIFDPTTHPSIGFARQAHELYELYVIGSHTFHDSSIESVSPDHDFPQRSDIVSHLRRISLLTRESVCQAVRGVSPLARSLHDDAST